MLDRTFAACGICLLVVGCATTAVNLPAVTDRANGKVYPGRVIWRDLISDTPEASRRFYETLFGWEFEPVGGLFGLGADDAYSLIRHDGELIGGMVDANRLRTGGEISQWVVAMSVPNVDAAVRTVESDGGSVLTPPTDIADRGRMAVVTDPQGALLALLETRRGDPPERTARVGDFLWDELWAADRDAASRFYEDLVGFTRAELPTRAEATTYRVLERDGQPRAGVLAHPFEGRRPVWVSYVRVEDPAAITARVASLGGQVYVDAQPRPVGGTVALIADPSGAGIALQTWPLESTQETAR